MMRLDMTALWDALGWAVLHSLWQGAAIGLIVWAVRALSAERHAALRYLSGMAGLVATLMAFLATFAHLAHARLSVGVKGATAPVGGDLPVSGLSVSVLPSSTRPESLFGGLPDTTSLLGLVSAEAVVPWLGMVWSVGFVFLALQAWRAFAQTRNLATFGLSEPDAGWTARFESLLRRSGAPARVRLYVSDRVSAPLTLGTLKPLVLVPAGFLSGLPAAQVEAVLLHELAHIRRHDFLFGLAQTAIRTLLYFNPAVILMSRQVDEDREKACDDFAVRMTGKPADLARGLATLRLGGTSPRLAMAADGGPLLVRLNRLMGRPVQRPAVNHLPAALLSALLLGTAAFGSASFAVTPPETEGSEARRPEARLPEAGLKDTVVRGDRVVEGDLILQSPDGGTMLVLNEEDMPSPPVPPVTPMPPMPAMPQMPVMPVAQVSPAPSAPAYSDYDSPKAFEAAMERWGEQMERWGETLGASYEGEWEERMEAWDVEMDAWSDAVDATVEQWVDQNGGLESLGRLSELETMAALSALEDLDFDKMMTDAGKGETSTEVRRFIQDSAMQAVRQRQQAEQQRDQAERQREMAEAQRQQAKEQRKQADRQRQQAERQREMAEAQRQQAKEQRKQAEQQREQAKKQREWAEEQRKKTVRQAERSYDERPGVISLNGRDVDTEVLVSTLKGQMVRDGLASASTSKIKLSLDGDTVVANGKTLSPEQSRTYRGLLRQAGLKTDSPLKLYAKPDTTQLVLGNSRNSTTITVGRYTSGSEH